MNHLVGLAEVREERREVPLSERVQAVARLVKQQDRIAVRVAAFHQEDEIEAQEPLQARAAVLEFNRIAAELVRDVDAEEVAVRAEVEIVLTLFPPRLEFPGQAGHRGVQQGLTVRFALGDGVNILFRGLMGGEFLAHLHDFLRVQAHELEQNPQCAGPRFGRAGEVRAAHVLNGVREEDLGVEVAVVAVVDEFRNGFEHDVLDAVDLGGVLEVQVRVTHLIPGGQNMFAERTVRQRRPDAE